MTTPLNALSVAVKNALNEWLFSNVGWRREDNDEPLSLSIDALAAHTTEAVITWLNEQEAVICGTLHRGKPHDPYYAAMAQTALRVLKERAK